MRVGADPCGTDDARTRHTADALQAIYGGVKPLTQREPIAMAGTDLEPGSTVEVVTPTSEEVWTLHLSQAEGQWELKHVEASTGADSAPPSTADLSSETQPFIPPMGWAVTKGIPAQTAVARVQIHLPNGASAERLWIDGQVACPLSTELAFTRDQHTWGAVQDGSRLKWHEWVTP